MKRVLVVAALLGAMLLVDWLRQAGSSGAASLVGMGFVMLSAYAVAELGSTLSLPQVTGYIVAGVVLGPSVGGVISGDMIGDMRMFNTLALGLIATSAGLELDLRQVVRLAKTLLVTTLIKIVVGVSLVALAIFAIETPLGLLGLGRAELATLALVLGVLSIGTSPSIALAVLTETRAKGRLSDLVLGAAVFKDVVVVVGLALATAIGRVWLSPGASLDADVLVDVSLELAGSVIAGGLVGLIFIVYVRFIRAEMLLFVAAMILVVAELCRAFHLELLLVFIASGLVVRNFSVYEHELMRPLRLVALPVFVLFFANAGASVDLLTTWTILPIALGACAARAAAYFLASHVGGKWTGESLAIRQQAWLAYLPQAGVTLGLVGLAGLQLPELVGPITNAGMAIVALNLLIGPITLRRALGRLGEIPTSEGAAESRDDSERLCTPALGPEPSPSPASALPEALRLAHADVARKLSQVLERFEAETEPGLPVMPELNDSVPDVEAFLAPLILRRERFRQLHATLMDSLATVPRIATVPAVAAGGLFRGLWPLPRRAKVPLRRIARIALGPPLAQLIARRFEAGFTTLTTRTAGGGQALPAEVEQGLLRFAEIIRDASARKLPLSRLRYSDVEPQVRRALHGLLSVSDTDLARIARAAWGTGLLQRKRAMVTQVMDDVVRRCLIEPGLGSAAKIPPATQAIDAWLGRERVTVTTHSKLGAELVRLHGDFDGLTRSVLHDLSREFRFAATVRATLTELLASVSSVPESIDCLLPGHDPTLSVAKIQSVSLRAHVDALVRHVMPAIDLAARSVAAALNQLPRRMDDAVQLEWSLLEAQVDSSKSSELARLVNDRLAQIQRRVDAVSVTTVRAVESAIATLTAALAAAYAAFDEEVLPGPLPQRRVEARLQKLARRVRRGREALSHLLQATFAKAPQLDDAAAIRRALHSARQPVLPDVVQRGFGPSPVTDERSFAGHRRLMNQVLDAEASRASLGRASLLVAGPKGSGKSSLLNMCELELPYSVHLRLHASNFAPELTLLEAMATLLDCPPTHVGLARNLGLRGPAIFVDDLESWISANRDRQLELERVLSLIAQTSHEALWVVSVDTSMLRSLREIASLDEVFTHIIQLSPLTLAEVKHVVEARVELLNVEVDFRSPRWMKLFDRLRSTSESERIYRRLCRTTGGNPGRVVSQCREAFRLDGQRLSLGLDSVQAPTAPNYDFSAAQLALLATLHRYGPLPLERLAVELAMPSTPLWRSLLFLISSGLVETVDDGHAFSISPAADWVVLETLVRARLATD